MSTQERKTCQTSVQKLYATLLLSHPVNHGEAAIRTQRQDTQHTAKT